MLMSESLRNDGRASGFPRKSEDVKAIRKAGKPALAGDRRGGPRLLSLERRYPAFGNPLRCATAFACR